MKILPNGIRTCIPKPNSFNQIIADRIVGEWESDIEDGEQIATMNK
jgi:hypothetical protein